MLLTAFQLVSAVNYQAFEEKKEFPLLNGIDVQLENIADDEDTQVQEIAGVAIVAPELLDSIDSKGYDILN